MIDITKLILFGTFYTLAVLYVGASFGWGAAERRYRPKSKPIETEQPPLFI